MQRWLAENIRNNSDSREAGSIRAVKMLTSFAAGKGLVLLTFAMLGWYISMAVGSPTMRQGLFRRHLPVQVMSPDAYISSDVTAQKAEDGLGIFHSTNRNEDGIIDKGTGYKGEFATVSQDGKPATATRHASKVARVAVPLHTFTMPSSTNKSQQSRNKTHLRSERVHRGPATCPPLKTGANLPRRIYPRRDRGNCSCTPVAPFILLSMQRSGSGWLETLLNSHPNVQSHGELFQVRKRGDGWREMQAALEEVFEFGRVSEEQECLSAVGLKWMLNQGALQYRRELVEYVRARGVSVVLLVRRNSLRRLISVLANIYDQGKKLVDGKKHRSHVHSAEEAAKLAHFRPRLNPGTLLPHLRHVQRTTDAAVDLLADTRHLVLHYEDLVADSRVVDRLQAFLGLPPRLLRSKQVQIHREGLEQHIANWDEVKSILTGTEFEHMLQ
ncbi:P-loop containing nucleoside triphosphate hydrolases superfamily protein [Klebsormidium nitens]|uniref:P-loop containing nucleoside triphosphate hydrolases superfamily protein n=1 Tax=Klebsormidium nitens TaxID=105231 RepID=A0A1Y1I0Q7_KLENI|nr:P-loop containing nucleoside triphosphate hydrolases superfamily protein [Klebsormidium nitens]|eukprot:GAQ84033.1 P-loop containing nucleoside triphosphate hydrolases superfamily protein [Klebsormidium nitens]